MSETELAKLCSELDVVHGNLNVFEVMLGDLEPGREHPEDWSLFLVCIDQPFMCLIESRFLLREL